MGLDRFLSSVKGGFEKVEKKAEEIVKSKEAQDFIAKAKDVAIDVGVKVTDVADEMSSRAKEAMHKAAEKNESKKAAANNAGKTTSEPVVEVLEGEVVEDVGNQ